MCEGGEKNEIVVHGDKIVNPLMVQNEKVRLRDKFGNVENPPEVILRADANITRAWNLFTDELKLQYLKLLAQYGNKSKCAKAMGIAPSTVRLHKRNDEEFAEALELSMEIFRDSIEEAIVDRAIHGWDEPVYSQRLGIKIGTIRRFDNRLLELLAKRHIPAFREKQQLDIQVGGGVLLIPQTAESSDEWEKKHNLDVKDTHNLDVKEAKVIDVEVRKEKKNGATVEDKSTD